MTRTLLLLTWALTIGGWLHEVPMVDRGHVVGRPGPSDYWSGEVLYFPTEALCQRWVTPFLVTGPLALMPIQSAECRETTRTPLGAS